MRYAIAQNQWHGDLPDGWSNECGCISGGRMGWGSSHTIDRVLDMVAKTIPGVDIGLTRRLRAHVMPLLRGRERVIVIADFEKPINPGALKRASLRKIKRVAQAMRLRTKMLKEMCEAEGIEIKILFWAGGFSWQNHLNVPDFEEFETMVKLRDAGAFDYYDGGAPRIYPQDAPGELNDRFDRIKNITHNSINAMRVVFGDGSFILPMFSWRTYGRSRHRGGEHVFTRDEIDRMAELGEKVAGCAGFWSESPDEATYLQGAA